MRIQIELHPRRLRQWHLWLVDALRHRPGTDVSLFLADAPVPSQRMLNLVLEIERLTSPSAERGTIPVGADAFRTPHAASSAGTAPDLILDFAHSGTLPQDKPGHSKVQKLTPLFDGCAGEEALWAAILDQRAPKLSLHNSATCETLEIGTPALETPWLIGRSADAVWSRLVEGMIGWLEQRGTAASGVPLLSPTRKVQTNPGPAAPIGASAPLSTMAQQLLLRVQGKLQSLLREGPRWHVAIGLADTRPPVPATQQRLSLSGFHVLADDGARFFADPFAIRVNGETTLFVEEFPFATERGLISAVTLSDDGRNRSAPRPVLERPYHLSYPQVFEHQGAIWMIPESSESEAIELYRADPFPDRWSLHSRLVEGRFHDATLWIEGDMFWMFAGGQHLQSGSWDALHLFYAPSLFGPWTAMTEHAVRIDNSSARPGGALVKIGKKLYRPAQDCSRGYGSALTWNEVTKLSPEAFAENPVGRVQFNSHPGLLGPHTWNTCSGLLLTDCYASAADIRAAVRDVSDA